MKNNLVNKQRTKVEVARDKHFEKWIALLTQNKSDRLIEFDEILANSKGTVFAIMKYRRMLRDRGRGTHFTDKELKTCNRLEESYLQEVLQEMFLEPISMGAISLFYELASKRGYNNMDVAMEELYNRHIRDTGVRFLSIALTI